ncbi:MAG: DUF2062 domain-containing protein [Marinifilaceae bacterium]|jgi:uncharacterized protein (DUF2062 family)
MGLKSKYQTLRKINIKQFLQENIMGSEDSNQTLALSIGLGTFMAFAPVWGFQMAIAVSLAILFRLNKVVVLLAANLSSIPPLVPLILYSSFQAGALLLQGSFLNEIPELDGLESLGNNLLLYLLGAILSGALFGLIGLIFSYASLFLLRKKGR